nr:biotin/lipoyl-containing protein [Flammeovirga sp. EKP202]
MMFDNMKMAHVTELFTEVGKEVKKGDILAEIETEIGVMELESYDDGIITYINPKKELLVNEIIMTGKGLNTNPTKPKTSENIANDSLEIRNVEVPKNGKAVIMPKMIDSMKSAIISKWHVKLGDIVKEGDILADVETDKATMELECYDNGIVTYINPKKEILVNDTIMVIGSHDSVEEKEEDLVKVPSLGRDINTVTISKWLVEIGDHVKVDDPLVEVESDKATFELVAERDGIIKSITNDVEVKVGDTILKYS